MSHLTEPELNAYRNDPYVHQLARAGCTADEIIGALCVQKQLLLTKLIKLESICPKRYRTVDGGEMIWHCPDDLIPITEI